MHPLILSTANYGYFASLIAGKIPNAELITTTRKRFPGGERYFRMDIETRDQLFGRNVIVVVGGCYDADDDFNEAVRIGSTAASKGATRVTYLFPFLGYSTMEREKVAGEVVTAKILAKMLSKLSQGDLRNAFFFLDLHTAGLINYFEGDCLRDELPGEETLSYAFEQLGLQNFMFASADLGRPRVVEFFADRYRTHMAFVSKKRVFDKTHIEAVIGEVRGQVVVIYDDMIRSTTTLVDAAKAYLDRGAKEVYAVASHLAFDNENAIRLLEDSPIVKVVSTNSHCMSQHPLVRTSKKIIVEDVSHLFARAIMKLNGVNTCD